MLPPAILDILSAFSFFTVLPCGMEFKQHCTGLSKHRELATAKTSQNPRHKENVELRTEIALITNFERLLDSFGGGSATPF